MPNVDFDYVESSRMLVDILYYLLYTNTVPIVAMEFLENGTAKYQRFASKVKYDPNILSPYSRGLQAKFAPELMIFTDWMRHRRLP